jgi:subtilisin family serine protease
MILCSPRGGALARTPGAATAGRLAAAVIVFPLAALPAESAPLAGEVSRARPGEPSARVRAYKVDEEVSRRKNASPAGTTRVIVRLAPGAQLPGAFQRFAIGGELGILNAVVLDVPNGAIGQLEARGEVLQIHHDRPIALHNYRTSVTVGASLVRETLGYTGAGIGVAVIDSGIATWHDDLTAGDNPRHFPYGDQRVVKFVDLVASRPLPYDDNGHGSHVAGIIAGNGYDSSGEKMGIAPDASIVSLKVLDANGQGTISNIIAALGWVADNHRRYNIRVVNLSVGAAIRESFWTDPLTLAARRVSDLGIVVVAAAGNLGKNADGELQYGGITAPGNAPWVLTVGASSTEGTFTRRDDVVAAYSSAGPTYKDFVAKPDVVAPGTGTVSLAASGSTFYSSKAAFLVEGNPPRGEKPYLTLTGTSMAAPVVSGTVALMLQANPRLTPNLIKAILQYTAQWNPDYNALRQGAGFLNAWGAVELARFYAASRPGDTMPVQPIWSQHIIWGNHLLSGGYLNPKGNAWSNDTVWGAAHGLAGDTDNIVWGTICHDCDNIVWGTADVNGDNIVWGTAGGDNIVWGTAADDNIVWGTALDADNIVWGTAGGDDNIVWGTLCGGADCDNIVWGTVDQDNIVWGTVGGDNIVWGTATDDNIVWGTAGSDDNIVWGTASDDNIVWGTAGGDEVSFGESYGPVPDPAVEFGAAAGSRPARGR